MTITHTYAVAGLTCGHCVSAVTSELSALPGVHDVSVDLVAAGTSRVHVVSDDPLEETRVREAVDEAGYELVADTT
jgi:copper chaperone CopZ